MSDIAELVSGNLDIWTSATQRKSGAGRGGSKRISFYGIERLRALILDLAVRGKLVPQDAGDEPAAELLKRMDASRAKQFPKSRSAPKLIATDADVSLPSGWKMVRLDRIANSQAGFAFKSIGFNDVGVGLPLIRIRDVGQPFTGTFYNGEYRDEFVVVAGDYLISMDGEFRVATWPGPEALLNQRVSRLQFFGEHCARPFVAIALQLELAKLQGVKAYTTVDHLSGKQISEAQIPLPPLAEQRRIVAKVDELMALCDALERESADALAAHHELVEELLATLVNSADAVDLAANWARLENHFDTLFTTETSIDALKKTILDLAVRGKLVEQDEGDETAENISAEVQRLMRAKGIKDHKSAHEINESDLPFSIPTSWKWVRLGRYVKLWNGFAFKSNDFGSEGVAVVRIGDLQNGEVDITGAMRVPEKVASQIKPQFWIPENALLIAMSGATTGKTAFNRTGNRLLLNQRVGMLEIFVGEIEYLRYFFETIIANNLAISAGSAIPNLSAEQINDTCFPLPPLAEQQRIVAKVDELMALCDALKTRISDAATTQKYLADAIVERAAA